MKIRVIQVQKFSEFQKNVTVEKLGYIKNPVEHKAGREREREREGISNGIDEDTETTLRIYGCDLIQESGILFF